MSKPKNINANNILCQANDLKSREEGIKYTISWLFNTIGALVASLEKSDVSDSVLEDAQKSKNYFKSEFGAFYKDVEELFGAIGDSKGISDDVMY